MGQKSLTLDKKLTRVKPGSLPTATNRFLGVVAKNHSLLL